jgi:hypothetical protein
MAQALLHLRHLRVREPERRAPGARRPPHLVSAEALLRRCCRGDVVRWEDPTDRSSEKDAGRRGGRK